MVRFTKSWLMIAVVGLGFVLGSACKKGGDAGGGGGSTNDDLSLIPADSEIVLGLNFAQLQQSALWKQYSPKLMDKMAGPMADFTAACGFNPITAFKSLTMGMKNLATKPEGVMIIHGPEKSKIMGCMDKAKAEAAKSGTEITVDGDVFLAKDKNGDMSAFTFADNTTLVGVMGPNANKDTVKAAVKGGSALKSSPAFLEIYKKINTGDSLWVLANGNSGLLDKLGGIGVKPKAIFGSLNVTDGLALDGRMRTGSPEEANGFVQMAKSQTDSPQVKGMVDKLEVTGDGPDVHVVIVLGSQKLQALVGMFGGMVGGLMGAAGGGAPAQVAEPAPPPTGGTTVTTETTGSGTTTTITTPNKP